MPLPSRVRRAAGAPRRLLLALALAAAACGRGEAPGTHAEQVEHLERSEPPPAPPPPVVAEMRRQRLGGAVAGAEQADAVAASGGASDSAGGAAAAEPPSTATAPAARSGPAPAREAAGAMLVRTGTASVEVDSLEPAIAALRALAARAGGYVAGTSLSGGREQVRSASLELRVPSDRFDDLLGGLRPLGRVERVDVQAEDVGEEFVDLGARVANARRLEERLIALLAQRAGRLADVLAVERELARVREEIERHEGRLRFLRTRVATSTLAVSVHEPPPLLGDAPSRNPIALAFREAWRNFVALLAALIATSGVWLPVGAVAVGAWRWRRRAVAARVRAPATPRPATP